MKSEKKSIQLNPEHGRQDLRKVIHIAIGMIGFAYPFLEWESILFIWIVATFCAWFLPSRIESLEKILSQDEIKLGYSNAMIAYGLTMAVGTVVFNLTTTNSEINMLMLLSVVAFGDGFSSLVGKNHKGTPLPYNREKTIVGSFAFIVFGIIGALALIFFFGVFKINTPFVPSIGTLPIFRCLIVMFVCAIVESMRWRVPDNIPIGIVAIIVILLTNGVMH